MRKLICILFFSLFVSSALRAQDTIYRINGEMMLVEMMQISGDSLQFRQDGKVMSISKTGLLRVNYSSGNSAVFSYDKVNQQANKVVLLSGCPDVPIKVVEFAYFLNDKEISSKQVNKMMEVQNNLNIITRYNKLQNTASARALGVALVIIGAAIPIRSSIVEKNQSVNNNTAGVKKDYTATLIVFWAISGIFTIGLQTSYMKQKKELVKLYNSTFYPVH